MEDKKNMTPEEMDNQEEMTVTLTLDDGKELECVVLTIFPAGDKEYIALLPMDDEYEIVADAFDELLDEQEYDEVVGEDELDD